MLLYYFADKDELITATLERVAARLTGILDNAIPEGSHLSCPDLLVALWTAVGSVELQPYMRLWLELAAASARGARAAPRSRDRNHGRVCALGGRPSCRGPTGRAHRADRLAVGDDRGRTLSGCNRSTRLGRHGRRQRRETLRLRCHNRSAVTPAGPSQFSAGLQCQNGRSKCRRRLRPRSSRPALRSGSLKSDAGSSECIGRSELRRWRRRGKSGKPQTAWLGG